MEDKNVYNGKIELILVFFSDLYSELNSISKSTSRLSSSLILYCLLTTYITYYCFNEIVNNFDIKRLFYFRQDFKNTYYFSAYTDYK